MHECSSFDHNSFVEIDANAFAEASGIYELRLASNGIFTVNSKAFSGMTALQKLDNAISVIDEDAFEGLDSLQELKLGANYIHRLTLSAVPTQLKRLELQDNLMDLMPDFPDDFSASHLAYLNNRLVSFTAEVFDPVVSTIEAIHFDYNLITSIPRTTFVSLIKKLLTNVYDRCTNLSITSSRLISCLVCDCLIQNSTLVDNPGIGWTADVDMRSDCPNGSVFEEIDMSSSSSSLSANLSDLTLFGCIQCIAGTYHDNSTGTCVSCSDVSSRAFANEDGAVMCQYCPYSSDLLADRKQCIDFTCNVYCWLTLSMGIAVPGLIFGSKFLLFLIMKSSKRTRRIDIKEREDMNDWRMGLMLHQLGEPGSPHDSLLDDEEDEEEDLDASANAEMPFRIYDLPEETKDVVLTTLRDYFQIRKEKRWQGLPPEQQEATREWNDVEWETFHMHRILSRSFYGEVFLGDYCGTQVVVKRVMTLRFEVKELADTIKDVELVVVLRHPNIVVCLGTMWSDPEHLCVISEYVKGGDLAAVLEVEALDRPNKNAVAVTPAPEPVDLESSEDSTPTPTPTMVYGVSMSSLATRFRMALDVCEALAYVHEMGVSHSDLRSRNVLVTELFRCKLSDFRPNSRDDTHHATQVLLIAGPTTTQPSDSEEEDEVNMEGVRFLQPETKEAASPVGPTLPLVAPEVLQHNSRHLGADIYSVGILLLELWFHPFISFQNDRPNNEYEARRRKKRKLRVAIEGGGEEEGKTGKAEEALPRTASTVQKHKQHNAVMRHFMSKLRMLASIGGTDAEADECSFGTTPTSSAASLSLSLSLSSSTAIVDKLSAAIEDCLQSDPKKRPTAKKLAALFQLLLDEVRAA
ncbi:hypothetical protein BBJ28_00020256 [Nothophytophthora sp. Chile5]|nr:hypothetical protein BBJ28_00020256 [Nothophytophthora sp. Chile5]